ncbi:UNVERIFIED_CONTAM: hypothetical protein Sradi_7081000 [Sesamum radiatum]|uniref:RNase H type-1 domain-containing protein n=1 Tax=Sesamum radiatum TaxID=300843 RepID=A0AAW2J5T1_SESRA
MNTGGTSKGNSGIAGAGGILKDHLGRVIFAFQERLGNTINTQTELRAIHRGLQICTDKGLHNIWIKIDVMAIIKLISTLRQGAIAVTTVCPAVFSCCYLAFFSVASAPCRVVAVLLLLWCCGLAVVVPAVLLRLQSAVAVLHCCPCSSCFAAFARAAAVVQQCCSNGFVSTKKRWPKCLVFTAGQLHFG